MADLQTLKAAIDQLSPDELNEIYNHIAQRRHASYWLVPSEDLAKILEIWQPIHQANAHLSEEEINEVIDDTLHEVRRERKAQANRGD